MSDLILSTGQQDAYEAFTRFILDPHDGVLVIEGYAGTGKTTLVKHLLEQLPKLLKTSKLINPDHYRHWDVKLTATTNQAADAFTHLTGEDTSTIHSLLGLRVHKDYRSGKTKLVVRSGAGRVEQTILFIDEASYIDKDLLKLIYQQTHHCKLVFIGDPAQLLNIGARYAPVFTNDFPTVRLTEVVRQAKGNPITDLATKFRDTVHSGDFFQFTPDGVHVRHLPREEFKAAYMASFNDAQWDHTTSKVLAWKNTTVDRYNKTVREAVKGNAELNVGDFAVVNQHAILPSGRKLTTNQIVTITRKGPLENNCGVHGHWFELDHRHTVFVARSLDERKARLKDVRAEEEWPLVRIIEDEWVDLRAAFACTIHKAQGSTFDEVFIDLDDLKHCRSGNQLARLLYVGTSRARHRVTFTGDLV